MPCSIIPDSSTASEAQSKPHPDSFDSAKEFSLDHFLEVRRLVALAQLEDRELKGYVFDDSLIGAGV